MLYKFSDLSHLTTESLYPVTASPHFPQPLVITYSLFL